MKIPTVRTWTVAALLVLLPALGWAQEGTLEKKKEGTYFVELGEVFLRTNDVPFGIGYVDEDGRGGVLPPRIIKLKNDDNFATNPRITVGLNRPDGKSKFSVGFWEFDEEKATSWLGELGVSALDDTLGIPGAAFTRVTPIRPEIPPTPIGYPNVVEQTHASMDRDMRWVEASWDRNIYETKRNRIRLLMGARYIEYYESAFVGYLYGEEQVGFPGDSAITYNDVQVVQGRAGSNRLGPKIGLESRLKLGNRFRLTARGNYSMGEESIVVHYANRSVDLTGFAIGVPGRRIIALQQSAPANVLNRYAGIPPYQYGLNFGVRNEAQHKFVQNADLQVRGEWTIGNTTPHVSMGLSYEAYWWFDVPTARGAIEGFRDNVDTIELVRHGDETPLDPRDDWMETVVTDHDGLPFSRDYIVKRKDILYDGLGFYIRFDF
jgi:hypothetical protein